VDYHFVHAKSFLDMISSENFLEHAEVFGKRYGTGWAETERLLTAGTHVFLDIDWQGARQVRRRFPGAVTIFIKPPSLEELERRLRTRGKDSEETIQQRMQEARSELSHAHEFDHVLVNEDFDRTVTALEAIVAPATG
jgi:guanylate kinase